MRRGNLNGELDSSPRNGSLVNGLGRLGDSVNPLFSSDHTPPLEARWLRLRAGELKTEPHVHTEIETLLVLIRGRHEVTVKNKDLVILAKEGDYIFIEPGDEHTWHTKEDTLLFVVRWQVPLRTT